MGQHNKGYNPAAEAFKNFDQDQPTNLLGSLHLDTEDEPRRGASRANSVRFDESALHGQFGHNSRSSTDYLPLRTGSGLGGHALTERSSSHKSDGRQSSAGQSTHSARASSFVFESRPLSATVPPFVPSIGPPPGLFILGPVPSIIRCWLDTNFSNDSLLYAAVCTGSYKSVINSGMIDRLGLHDQTYVHQQGQQAIKIPVYLPEATIQQSSSRSSSPAPQLPTLTVEFAVQDSPAESNGIQVFLGCDVLRARNADIHFSLDRLTLFDDERNKLSVPLVRPENSNFFQNLLTTDIGLRTSAGDSSLSKKHDQVISEVGKDDKAIETASERSATVQAEPPDARIEQTSVDSPIPSIAKPSVIGQGRKSVGELHANEKPPRADIDTRDTESLANGSTPDTPTRSDSGSIWGSWRRDSAQGPRPTDALSSTTNSNSGYQRVGGGRGRGMKVLKPARLNTSSRSSSAAQQPSSGFDATPGRFSDAGKWPSPTTTTTTTTSNENQDPRHPSSATDRRFSGGAKSPLPSLTGKPNKSNPVGGASAFGWLNSGQQKQQQQTDSSTE
ncbi:MAG: hypothetical protein Q9179_003849 [Wetmoreana sp. 5 TL-2023]